MATKLIQRGSDKPTTGLIVTENNFKSLHNLVVARGKGSLQVRAAGGYTVKTPKGNRVAEVGDAIVRTIVDGVHKFEVVKYLEFETGKARLVGA